MKVVCVLEIFRGIVLLEVLLTILRMACNKLFSVLDKVFLYQVALRSKEKSPQVNSDR